MPDGQDEVNAGFIAEAHVDVPMLVAPVEVLAGAQAQ
jgi:hypothetical protein